MARPQKFRLSPDDVLDPQNARKLAGHVAEIELWRKEIEKLQDNIAGVYDAADEDGFDNKFIRKLVALRSKDETTRQAEEHGVDCYSQALDIGFSSRARVENPEHDPITGEIGNTDSIPEHDAETGEINEPEAAMLPQTGGTETLVAPHPVANVGEDASGAIASASVNPASREADDADRQQLAASGFSGDAEAGASDATAASAPHFISAFTIGQTEPVAIHAPDMATVAGDRSEALTPAAAPVVASKADFSKPNPACAVPDDCGVEAIWNHMCGSCLRRRAAQQHSAEAVH